MIVFGSKDMSTIVNSEPSHLNSEELINLTICVYMKHLVQTYVVGVQ